MRLVIEDGAVEGTENYGTQERLREVFERCLEMQESKAKNYGQAWRDQGYVGNLARVLSKVSRLRYMMWREYEIENAEESRKDSFYDLINLAAFAILNLNDKNRWGNRG